MFWLCQISEQDSQGSLVTAACLAGYAARSGKLLLCLGLLHPPCNFCRKIRDWDVLEEASCLSTLRYSASWNGSDLYEQQDDKYTLADTAPVGIFKLSYGEVSKSK